MYMGGCQAEANLCKIYGFRTWFQKLQEVTEESARGKLTLRSVFQSSVCCGQKLFLPSYSCQTLCNPPDGSPDSCSIHGILQARILEWVSILFFHFTSSFGNYVNILFLFQSLFILLMLGLRCCEWAFSSYSCCAGASHCSGFSCFGAHTLECGGSRALEHRLSSCGPWA